jgi:hypothetical protein
MFSRPGMHRQLQLWSKPVWRMLPLLAELGLVHVMLLCMHAECKCFGGVTEPSTDFKRRPVRPGSLWQG